MKAGLIYEAVDILLLEVSLASPILTLLLTDTLISFAGNMSLEAIFSYTYVSPIYIFGFSNKMSHSIYSRESLYFNPLRAIKLQFSIIVSNIFTMYA